LAAEWPRAGRPHGDSGGAGCAALHHQNPAAMNAASAERQVRVSRMEDSSMGKPFRAPYALRASFQQAFERPAREVKSRKRWKRQGASL